MDELVREKVRCKPGWQNKPGYWRRDYVWVQEHANESDEYSRSSINGKLVSQVQVVITIQDLDRRTMQNGPVTYCGALIKLLRPWSKGIDKTTGMLELQPWRSSTANHPRVLGAIRFYEMSAILRSVHVVPDDGTGYYVNNYVDWDTYNTIYADTFFTDGVQKARQYKRSL